MRRFLYLLAILTFFAAPAFGQTFANNTCNSSSLSNVVSSVGLGCTPPNTVDPGTSTHIVNFSHTTRAGMYTSAGTQNQNPNISDGVNSGQNGQKFTMICGENWNPINGKPAAQQDFSLALDEVATTTTAPLVIFFPFSNAPVDMFVTEIDNARRDVCSFSPDPTVPGSGAGDSSTGTLSTGKLYPSAPTNLVIVHAFEDGAPVGSLTAGPGCSIPANGSSTTSASIIEVCPGVTSGQVLTVANSATGHPYGIMAVGFAAAGTIPLKPVLPQNQFNGGNLNVPTPAGITCTATAGSMSALQTCINNAPCDSIVKLVHGSTYGPGTLQLPHKGCTNQWVLVETDNAALLPLRNTRISTGQNNPSAGNIANMAEIQGVAGNFDVVECAVNPSCDHYWFVGIMFDFAPSSTSSFTIVNFDPANNNAGTPPSSYPFASDHMVLDHSWIFGHGVSGSNNDVRTGVSVGGTHIAVIDSMISDITNVQAGGAQDTTAIGTYENAGPILIQNNSLNAFSENIIFGGASPNSANGITQDVTIQGNYIWKRTSWNGVANISIKNLVEFKQGQRILITGNALQNYWGLSQQSGSILTNPGFSNFNGSPFLGVYDYTFTNNWLDSLAAWINLGKGDFQNPPSMGTVRALVQNNLCSNVGVGIFTNGTNPSWNIVINTASPPMQGQSTDIWFDHNTCMNTQPFFSNNAGSNQGVIPSVAITNNLAQCTNQSNNCVQGGGLGGATSWTTSFPGALWQNNAIMTYTNPSNMGTLPASTTTFGAQSTVGFTNLTVGNTIGGMPPLTALQLTGGSSIHNTGSDPFNICQVGSVDIGVCNWTTLNTDAVNAIAGMFNGGLPPPPPPPAPAPQMFTYLALPSPHTSCPAKCPEMCLGSDGLWLSADCKTWQQVAIGTIPATATITIPSFSIPAQTITGKVQ